MSAPSSGQIGPYRIEAELGRGAMGVVYAGIDERDGQRAAIKTIDAEVLTRADTDEFLSRFRREAEIGMRLQHPGIVRALSHGDVEGKLYLAMELVEGQELADLMKRGGPPTAAEAHNYLGQLLSALDYAHGQGVVHRDIKPANMMVNATGRLKLMDFGVAHSDDSNLTRADQMLGTPTHMAPEQIRGEPVDGRTDLFAAGVVLYTLLAGRRPFNGSVHAVIGQILAVDPPPPSKVNSELSPLFDTVVVKALAKAPDDRHQSAAAFREALDRAWEYVCAMDEDGDADATVIAMPKRPPVPSPAPAPDVPTPAPAAGESIDVQRLVAQLKAALRTCLDDQVTESRLSEVASLLNRVTGGDVVIGSTAIEDIRSTLVDSSLPPLVERILQAYPDPGAKDRPPRRDWIIAVRLFVVLRDALAKIHAREAGQEASKRIAAQLLNAFLSYSSTLNMQLFAEADPDVASISMDLLRLDVLHHALDELGATTESAQARDALCSFAGQIMAKANAILGSYVATRDMLAGFGVANLLAALEELISIAERMFDAGEGDMAQRVHAVGLAVIRDFADKSGQLVEIVVDELRGDVGRTAADTNVFTHRVEQVGLIYAFATRVRDPHSKAVTEALVDRVYSAVERLTDDLNAVLKAETPGEDQGVEIALQQLNVLVELAERFGWEQLRRRVLADLRDHMVAHPEALNELRASSSAD